jgi:hypothetical protein
MYPACYVRYVRVAFEGGTMMPIASPSIGRGTEQMNGC